MKAININGNITPFGSVPTSWKNVVGNFNLLSEAELEAYGFYDLYVPNFDARTHQLGDIAWVEENNRYEHSLVALADSTTIEAARNAKEEELRSNLYNKLKDTDWYIIRKYERSIEVPSEVSSLRQSYIETYEQKQSDIINIEDINGVLTFNTII